MSETGEEWLFDLVDRGIREDVGSGDWTTLWTVPEGRSIVARIIAKGAGVLAGTQAALATMRRVDPSLATESLLRDGSRLDAGDEVMRVSGSARSLLTAERLALNFLQHLSGIATETRRYVDAVEGTSARILDTRKTTPGLRALEKQAVRAGGGANHRFGLHDMILIKENHIRAAGGITAAVRAVAERNRMRLAVEVEATNLDEVGEALVAGVDRILFDNMSTTALKAAVELVRSSGGSVETEASGGISLHTVREIAFTGVDYISVGAITHSAPALDLSMLFDVDA